MHKEFSRVYCIRVAGLACLFYVSLERTHKLGILINVTMLCKVESGVWSVGAKRVSYRINLLLLSPTNHGLYSSRAWHISIV